MLNWLAEPEADAAHGDRDALRARGGRRQVRLEEEEEGRSGDADEEGWQAGEEEGDPQKGRVSSE